MRRITTTSYPFFGLDSSFSAKPGNSFPLFNVVDIDETKFAIEFAVAGYSREELSVTQEGNYLVVSGTKEKTEDKKYFFKGIAERNFERKIPLRQDSEISNARLENGILEITLTIKEENKKSIQIG